MHPAFLTFIKEKALIESDDSILLAVSGGVDSMVLLHLCHRAGFQISVAHVNFGLRGDASDADELLVRTWCEKHEVPFFLKSVGQEVYDGHGSVEMIARELRYNFFESLRVTHGFTKIATAHHLNDSLETVLFNLTKGTGIAGLTGVAAKKDYLIRPLLFADKAQIYAFAKAEKLEWREDATNHESDYQRNLIRNGVIPILEKINPALITRFRLTQERIQGAREWVTSQVDKQKEEFQIDGSATIIKVDWYRNDDKSKVLLAELIKEYGFSYTDAGDISKAILSGKSGKIFLAEKFRILLDREELVIEPQAPEIELIPASISPGESASFGNYDFSAEIVEGNSLPRKPSRDVGYFDAGALVFPLNIRSYQEGDFFHPLGLKGKKKLSDFFIDQKVALHKKSQIPILESQGDILWVAGYRLDDRYKVSDTTQNMLKVTISRK